MWLGLGSFEDLLGKWPWIFWFHKMRIICWPFFAAEGIYSLEMECVLDVCFKQPTQQCKHFATCSLRQSLRRKWSSCVHTDQSFHVRREHAGMCNDWDNEFVKGSYTMNDQTTRFSENNVCESISWISYLRTFLPSILTWMLSVGI